MQRFYIIPLKVIENRRGPKYIKWSAPGVPVNPADLDIGGWTIMDYGFAPYCLLLAKDIDQGNHDALVANLDVYGFPETLNQAISPQDNLDTFFEGIGIPTDWLQPSNTYLEFLRQLAAMFQFNQRYEYISSKASGVNHSIIDDVGDLNTRRNSWSQNVRNWFDETLVSFGYPLPSGNPSLRQLMKQAADAWGDSPFYMGEYVF